jgi:hypothetical protein
MGLAGLGPKIDYAGQPEAITRPDRVNSDSEFTFLGISNIRLCVLEARSSSPSCNFLISITHLNFHTENLKGGCGVDCTWQI